MPANPATRLIAFLIDLFLFTALALFFYFYLHFGDYLSWLLASVYILVKDGLLHGQSLGKLLVRLRTVKVEGGGPASLSESLQRNAILVVPSLFRFIPFLGSLLFILVVVWEIYLMYTHPEHRRWGDQVAGTQVVEA
jgi:uncharacterized RDD family membrane protein YckC